MKKLRSLLVFIIVFGLIGILQASDLSKIKFYDAYMFDEFVQQASETGAIDGKIATCLMDEEVGVDIKAAVINALSWDGTSPNLSTYRMFLGRKYRVNEKDLNMDILTAHEQFCIGYMTFLTNDSNAEEAATILEKAKTQLSDSYTINIILAIVKASGASEKGEWCAAWTTCEKVVNDAALNIDMEAAAIEAINSDLESLKEKCN